MRRIISKDDVTFDDIVKEIKNTKELICMPLLYTPAQRITSKLIEFFQKGSRVVWSASNEGIRHVQIYYCDTKEQGSHLMGTMPEENWDELAFHFFQSELNQLGLFFLDQAKENEDITMLPESEKVLRELIFEAKAIWKRDFKLEGE